MVIKDQQLDLFEPLAAALAIRDTPYNSTAHALAELVDNSIDARAREVDVLIQNERENTPSGQFVRVVQGIAVADNGHGMPEDVLARALVVGGRPQEGGNIRRRMGKYGVGLPTSSLSQCQRVDVWTWQDGIESAWRCYLDVNEVKSGQVLVPAPVQDNPPDFWLEQCRSVITDSPTGTLVVWSQLDRVNWRTSRTTMQRLEEEVGRIYRDFITRHEVSIAMQSFGAGSNEDTKMVRPNDPLYLMTGTVHPHHKDNEPMFETWAEKPIRVTANGAQYEVEIKYSIVKSEVLTNQGYKVAGTTAHGRGAARNIGISVMREGRELMTLPPLNNGDDPRHRWWGCELRFNRRCDDIFGVDHSKQLATRLQSVHSLVKRRDPTTNIDEDELIARNENDINTTILYDIVKTINVDTAEMFRIIRGMRSRKLQEDTNEETRDFSSGASVEATESIKDAIQKGNTSPTQTEEEREKLDPSVVESHLEKQLIHDGTESGLAKDIAAWVASNDVGYVIVPGRVSGSALFDVHNDHGTTRIILNQEHRLYRLLEVLTDREEIDVDYEETSREISSALFILLCAWARMVEHTPNTPARQRYEDTVKDWGREATHMLTLMSRRIYSDEE